MFGVTLVSEKDDSFENYGSLYYKWDSERKVLLVYIEGFESFLREERGTVVLSDLIPYDLGTSGEYNPMTNNLVDVNIGLQIQNQYKGENYSGSNGCEITGPKPPGYEIRIPKQPDVVIIPSHKEEKNTDESKSGFIDGLKVTAGLGSILWPSKRAIYGNRWYDTSTCRFTLES